jgi:hypothetical protein
MTKQAGYSSDFDAASKVNQQNIGSTHDIESMHKLALNKVNLATKETSRIAETTKTSAEIMDEVEVGYGKLEPLLKEAEAYCWKVYSILFKEKNRIESLYVNEYKSLSPEFLVENFTYISLKNTKISLKHQDLKKF